MNEFAYIDESTIRSVVEQLSDSPEFVDRHMARYLTKALDVWTGNVRSSELQQTPMEQLGLAVMQSDLSGTETRDLNPRLSSPVRMVAGTFLAKFLRELRNILCGTKKDRNKLSAHSHGALSALAVAIMQICHVSSVTATGIAVLILVSIGRASKKAFCDMTDEEALEALMQN
jgi:hypothetical protein